MTTPTAAPLPEPEVLQPGALVLAGDFPPAELGTWRHLAAQALVRAGRLAKDAADDEAPGALATMMPDGFAVQGLYTASDIRDPAPVPRPAARRSAAADSPGAWDVRTLHDDPDPVRTHTAIHDDLEGGATSIWLRLGATEVPVESLPDVLEGVYLELAPVVLDAGAQAERAAELFFACARERSVKASDLPGVLGVDSLWLAAAHGTGPDYTAAVALTGLCVERYPLIRALVVDTTGYADAGATDGQELGLALATGIAYLRVLTDAGHSVGTASRQLEFRYSISADQFAGIAKLRAARRIWARALSVSGVALPVRQHQHAVTARSMFSRYDPHTNLVRATIAAFAAGVGGAGAVTVLPFDDAIGPPDAFSRRIARNTSLLLLEEAHVGAVVDPAGGSWAVEALTDSLARSGWETFQQIERAGGMATALGSGQVAEWLGTSLAGRRDRIDTGADGVVGVTVFPDLGEFARSRTRVPRMPGSAFPPERAADPFEALRDRYVGLADPAAVVVLTVGEGARGTAASVERRLGAVGIRPLRAVLDGPLPPAPGAVVVCAAPDADAESVSRALRSAAGAGARLVVPPGDAADGGILKLAGIILDVLDPAPGARR